ncbi:putative urease accessory protein UreF-like protein [Chaetomidium leptoderma]|uniref:Urease accessory protein UreF-like protein n=1 Tax=Chaetomidium leptoderma TaxID=669021 RepID=A0AAN7A1V5_9PEZI|nr:putative urease accessory protein UreF-like protein [Chaetomidium leptoderma]
MISWALKRNSDSARDAPVSDDTTQIDLPDTPAPVFAVRALKTALFGTTAPRDRRAAPKIKEKTAEQTANPEPTVDKSPAKPPGILLTPGTGTTRRKRVSFGHDVKQGSGGTARASTTGLPDECPGKFPSPWVDRDGDEAQPRPKTKLQQAMENSRKGSVKDSGTDEKDFACTGKEPEDAWEEVDDESDFEADITTDLNEPHSGSGKYWKSYFETYHSDAKTEMERLVKYKHLAKSYAKMKDAEALGLNQKLKEEQEKVKALEEKVAEMARYTSLTGRKKGGESDSVLMDEVKKQTALATEYKLQVEELEALLQDNIDEVGDGGQRQRRTASPRTQRTLMEAQRELRRARSQVRELDKLQEERDQLRSDMKFAEQRASKLAEENRKLSSEVSRSGSRIQDLEKRLEDSKGSYDKLKDDAKARYLEAQHVLQKKNEKISELQEELESLRKGGTEPRQSSRPTRAKSFDRKATTLGSLESAEKESGELKRRASKNDVAASTASAETKQREKRNTQTSKRASHDDATLAQARALREKLEAEFGTKGLPASSVLSDRGNLQDSQSSASSGRSAHGREDQPPPYSKQTGRPFRSTAKATLDGLLAKRASKTSLEQHARNPPARPLSPESDTSPDVGGANAQSSGIWNTMNTSRTAIPEHRKTAALARIQRRIAERKMLQQQLGRDKENARPVEPISSPLTSSPSTHFLLLLSDSALPLGSFAFSSGLESYLAHQKSAVFRQQPAAASSFAAFLPLSISSYAATTLPFVLAAHRDPSLARLAALDDLLDASIVCTVGRRASVAQGRALLSIWERSFAGASSSGSSYCVKGPTTAAAGVNGNGGDGNGGDALKEFSALLRSSTSSSSSTASPEGGTCDDDNPPAVAAHLAPLFGAICARVGLGLEQTAYVFMLGHVKALVSAAVRAGVFGPYQAQKTLASGTVQGLVTAMIEREWETPVEEAGQSVPVMDLWVGRHEVLYSRIFNS